MYIMDTAILYLPLSEIFRTYMHVIVYRVCVCVQNHHYILSSLGLKLVQYFQIIFY